MKIVLAVRRSSTAFTLLEVMIALAIFFMAIFAILGLVSQNIAAAARLQRNEIDIASVATDLLLTNLVQEGVESGDFGDWHPGASWTRTVSEVSSNGLFQVDIVVARPPVNRFAKPPPDETLSLLLYRPNSGSSLLMRGGRR
jgi:hypothetical protein